LRWISCGKCGLTQEFARIVVIGKNKSLKPVYFIFILYFIFCSTVSQAQRVISDSLIKEVIQSIYPEKSFLKIRIEEMPSKIFSKHYWENDHDRSLVLYVSKFDSTFIDQQLSEREIIYVDSIIKRNVDESSSTKNDFISIHYILFSKDMKKAIIKEQHYCGEDCGRDMTMLYKKNKKGEWVIEKSIIGGIY
jgi:hypothetical protein